MNIPNMPLKFMHHHLSTIGSLAVTGARMSLLVCMLTILFACNSTTTTVTTNSDTQITTFRFVSQDSFPAIGSTTFTILNSAYGDTGLIYNRDSMTYNTPIHRLVPRFTFKSTPSSAVMVSADTSFALTGRDTIDFRKDWMVRVTSSDLTAVKYYKIEVEVHQVDPDLFVWQTLQGSVLPSSANVATKGLSLNDGFAVFANDGFSTMVYMSYDGSNWDEGELPLGLPANALVRHILPVDTTYLGACPNKLYYCQDGKIYSSTDGLQWQEQDLSAETYYPTVMLMSFNDSVWVLMQHTVEGTYHLAVEDKGSWRTYTDALPENWPVTEFAAIEFVASSLRHRAMIIGGYDAQGNPLSSRWNIEYGPSVGYRFANFDITHPKFSAILGAQVLRYGSQFYLFGGTDAESAFLTETALCSNDEGMTWQAVDTIHNPLHLFYSARTENSAWANDGYIYLFGGQDRTTVYTDLLCGRLTSIDWE